MLRLFVIIILWSVLAGARLLQAAPARIDLSHRDLSLGHDLMVPWDFFPGLDTLPHSSSKPSCQHVPGYWQDVLCGDRYLLAQGSGVFRLQITGIPSGSSLQFYLLRAFLEFELYVNGELVAAEGSAAMATPSRPFIVTQDTTEIILKIRNPDFMYGGLYNKIRIGLASHVQREERLARYWDIFFASCMAILGLYHLAFYGLRPRNKAPLLFAVFCFLVCYRTLYVGQGIAFEILGIMRSEYDILWVMYVTYYLAVPTFAYFTYFLFSEEFPRRAAAIALFTSTLFVLPIFITPFSFWQLTAPAFHLFMVFYMSYTVFAVIQAVRKKRDGAFLFLMGVISLCLSTLNDIATLALNFQGQDNAVVLGLFCFLILQSFILAQRFSHAFDQAEQLSIALKEQERARTQFFHNISHELRTPLNGIIGYLDLVRKGQFGPIAQAAFTQLGKALHLAESLTNQVNTILDLAKAKGGELKLVHQTFSLRELLDDADRLAEGLKLRDENLSYSSNHHWTSVQFKGDRDKTFTIIRNLLGNAFKFRDPNRLHVVRLTLQRDESSLRITISDTGIGIPSEFHSKIFEEFGQVEGDARRHYEGTGLGLNLVQKIVHLMNGRISLNSEVGVGTEFVVVIPEAIGEPSSVLVPRKTLALTETKVLDASELRPMFAKAAVDHNDIRVLVIDDNEINCDVVKGTLQLDGYQVQTVLSGRQGLLQMRLQPPDLVLLDMMMPEMSGEDVLLEMKKEALLAEIPVILVTARASEEDRIEGLRLGADDYLPKPIFATELRLRVRNMVERNRLLREVSRATESEKLAQLGELFGDLSHELKNILQGSSFQKLHEEDAILAASVMGLEAELQENFTRAMLKPSLTSGIVKRIDQLQSALKPGSNPDLYLIVHRLAELDADIEALQPILASLENLGNFEQRYFSSQLRLFSEFKSLLSVMERCRYLTQSVLAYSRMDDKEVEARLDRCWEQAWSLIQPQIRKSSVRWDIQLSPVWVAISPAGLTQILINLAMNARDAVQKLTEMDQWVRVSLEEGPTHIVFAIRNGGPAIPPALQQKLFARGFTTKGDKGSGIGLHVSRRLAMGAAGDLSYGSEEANPCFLLRLPRVTAKRAAS